MSVLDQAQQLIREGWRVEYSDAGACAYLTCRWCKGERKKIKRCDLCKGAGAEQIRWLA